MPPAPAVRSGNLVFLSGQIALDEEGNLVGIDDPVAQANRCFLNIQGILARVGGTMADIVKLTTYFTRELDVKLTQDYWAVRKSFFGAYKPASTGVQVKALIYPACLIEIEAVAVLRSPAP
jgi:enamine deaminase RidA (YjgF/YER057c/UK114 family)